MNCFKSYIGINIACDTAEGCIYLQRNEEDGNIGAGGGRGNERN